MPVFDIDWVKQRIKISDADSNSESISSANDEDMIVLDLSHEGLNSIDLDKIARILIASDDPEIEEITAIKLTNNSITWLPISLIEFGNIAGHPLSVDLDNNDLNAAGLAGIQNLRETTYVAAVDCEFDLEHVSENIDRFVEEFIHRALVIEFSLNDAELPRTFAGFYGKFGDLANHSYYDHFAEAIAQLKHVVKECAGSDGVKRDIITAADNFQKSLASDETFRRACWQAIWFDISEKSKLDAILGHETGPIISGTGPLHQGAHRSKRSRKH